MVKQGVQSVHQTDKFVEMTKAILAFSKDLSESEYSKHLNDLSILVDHLRSSVFLAGDGVNPSNTHQGYILRRLMRRAIRKALLLGIENELFKKLAPVVVHLYKEAYPILEENKALIIETLDTEETLFRKTLKNGLKKFDKLSSSMTQLTGEMAFQLFDTYGFPLEISKEEAKKRDMKIADSLDADYAKLIDDQRKRSRTASRGVFKGGLADTSELSVRYHTATHLLYRSLKNILGDTVVQRGSNINNERTRFDFSFNRKVTPEELSKIERMVNDAIDSDYRVTFEELRLEDAFQSGAIGAFGERYPDIVKVYTVGDPKSKWFSREICGGPHVTNTGKIGKFKIIKEEASSAGVRRIKAVII
jgi:alanyl-tRNA synthetase